MTILSCEFKIDSWSIFEVYKEESSKELEVILFGSVQNSDEALLDGFGFQVKFNPLAENKFRSEISENHLFIEVKWSHEEMMRLEHQLEICDLNKGSNKIKLNMSANLEFQESFTFELPTNKACTVQTFFKSLRKIT